MIISNKYKVLQKIGQGEFGNIFKGENIHTKELVAIKMENINSELNTLKRETQIYQYLGKHQGIPSVKWYGTNKKYNYMVLPLYLYSLNDFYKNQNTFSLDKIFQIGKNIIDILKFIHGKRIIHRDIKPDNFCIDEKNQINIIDFGMCKQYKNEDEEHMPISFGKSVIGTLNYISINIHNGIEPSRRDDLESVGYILLFLLNGNLEWTNVYIDKMKNVKEQCINTNMNIEPRIQKYIIWTRQLKFDENPDYEYAIQLLQQE